MPVPTTDIEGIMYSSRLAGHPSIHYVSWHYFISIYLAKGFQWNLPQIFIIWEIISEKLSQSEVVLTIVCKLYYYDLCSYLLEVIIDCVQMC